MRSLLREQARCRPREREALPMRTTGEPGTEPGSPARLLAGSGRPDIGIAECGTAEERPRSGQRQLACRDRCRTIRLHRGTDPRVPRVGPDSDAVCRGRRGVDIVTDPLLVDVMPR